MSDLTANWTPIRSISTPNDTYILAAIGGGRYLEHMKQALLLVALTLVGFGHITAQGLRSDEIVARHLETVGPKDKRDGLSTLMITGLSEFETSSPAVKGGGKAIVVSDPRNFFFLISLNSREYAYDKIGYFDGKVSLPFVSAGNRSLLGAFINEHQRMLADGVFGGVMSLRWPLLQAATGGGPKLQGASVKKIDGKKVYAVDFDPGSGGMAEFAIRFFFDADTFNHIRTEYRYEVQPNSPTFNARDSPRQNQIASAIGMLTEEFSDFRKVEGMTLPFRYRVEFTSNSASGAYKSMWGIRVAEYRFNQKLADGFFTFDAK